MRLQKALPFSRYRMHNATSSMSALGHKRTFAVQNVMSALPPIADMCSALADVRFSNRPVWVKRFQTSIAAVSMSLTGSCFSSESAPGPFHYGIRGRGGTI